MTATVPAFDRFFITQTALRGLDAAFLIDRKGTLITQTVIDSKIKFENLPIWVFDRVDERKNMVLRPGQNNVVRAVVKLEKFAGLYLYVHRFIDEVVVDHLRKARESKVEYATLEGQRYGVQITFALMYVGVSLIFLLAAIWLGFSVADRMVQPIVRWSARLDRCRKAISTSRCRFTRAKETWRRWGGPSTR